MCCCVFLCAFGGWITVFVNEEVFSFGQFNLECLWK